MLIRSRSQTNQGSESYTVKYSFDPGEEGHIINYESSAKKKKERKERKVEIYVALSWLGSSRLDRALSGRQKS